MKVILDNIIYFLQRSGGMSVYWSEMITRLESDQSVETHYLEPSGQPASVFYSSLRQTISTKIEIEKKNAKLLSFLPYRDQSTRKHIFHSSYYRTSTSSKAINVVTIHDFIPELFFNTLRKAFHTYRKKKAIARAHAIVCISNNTYNDLIRYYPGVKEIPVKVIYNGVSAAYTPLSKISDSKLNLPDKYVLFVGKRPPYKNFQFAIDAISKMDQYSMVIVGDPLTRSEENDLQVLEGRFTLVTNPSNETLNILYNRAHCLLYPSSYEGFGIPVIEAMKAGCPVVALRAGAVEEISGQGALLADGLLVSEFSQYISDLENITLRKTLRAAGIANAKRFDWDQTASELTSFYRELFAKYDF